jgi:branched-chain amino acid transport system ATP-binding protein
MMRVLEVVGLAKRYGDLSALDAVSFTVEEGQIVGLCGPSGAGKTIALDCLSGFAVPDGGRIIIDGREVTGLSAARFARAGVGRTFQGLPQVGDQTPVRAVALAARAGRGRRWSGHLRLWRAQAARERACEILERVGLAADADRSPARLTAGMRRRLELATVIAAEPRLVLLDEPLGTLAPDEAGAVGAAIAQLRASGTTAVIAERDPQSIAALADRLIALDRGIVVASERAHEAPPARPLVANCRS